MTAFYKFVIIFKKQKGLLITHGEKELLHNHDAAYTPHSDDSTHVLISGPDNKCGWNM